MTKRTYRGRLIDIDSLSRQHDKTVAAGNMSVNAAGDTLGRGGKIIETVQQKSHKNRKAAGPTKSASLRGNQENEKVFQDEQKRTKKKKADEGVQSSNIGNRSTPRKKKESETPEGDIIIEDGGE